MKHCPHSEFRKGTKVLVMFTNGKKLIDKYVEKKSGCVFLERRGKVLLSDVRQICINRG